MKSHETNLAANRQSVLGHLGISEPLRSRVFEGEVGALSPVSALMRLPPELGAAQQTEDGTLVFMLGHSGLGLLPLA